MPVDVHTIERPDGDQSSWGDRVFVGHQFGITIAGGASPQTIAVSWLSQLPTNYMVDTELNLTEVSADPIGVAISAKTSTGFNVVLSSPAAIPAGTMNVMVTG